VFVTKTFVESLCNQFFQRYENEINFLFYSIDKAVVHLKQTNRQNKCIIHGVCRTGLTVMREISQSFVRLKDGENISPT
jgi:hypothetical protein